MEKYDSFIAKLFSDKNGRISSRKLSRFIKKSEKYSRIDDFLKNRFQDIPAELFSYNEVIWRIIHQMEERPTCVICGEPVKFGKNKNRGGIPFYLCCEKNECRVQQRRLKCFEHHGYYSSLSDPEVHRKTIESTMSKYSKEERVKKTADTCERLYGARNVFSKNSSIREKIYDIIEEKYGVRNSRLIPGVEEKIKETNLKKYGCEYGLSSKDVIEKRFETLEKKYGEGITNVFQLSEIKLKSIQTLRKNYADETLVNISQVQEIKDYLALHKDERMQKQFETKKNNGTLGKSVLEDELYEKLKLYFPNIVSQYKSNDYPFSCDFYLPDKDLYIEFQGFWTHGTHRFNSNNENDLEILNGWIQRDNTGFYKNAIETWTIRDVNKVKCAEDNNLNFLSIYDKTPLESIETIVNIINSFNLDFRKRIYFGEK